MNFVLWTSLKRIAGGPAVRYTALAPLLGFILLWSEPLDDFLRPIKLVADVFESDVSSWPPSFIFSNTIPNTLLNMYFGLVLLGFGYILHSIWCPEPIQRYATRQDFVQQEIATITPRRLEQLRTLWLNGSSLPDEEKGRPNRGRKSSIDLHLGIEQTNADWLKVNSASVVDTLGACYDAANLKYAPARTFTFVLFVTGLSLSSLPALRTLFRITTNHII